MHTYGDSAPLQWINKKPLGPFASGLEKNPFSIFFYCNTGKKRWRLPTHYDFYLEY